MSTEEPVSSPPGGTRVPMKPKLAPPVAEAMALQKLQRRWRVQECSATLGTGVEQSVDLALS